MTENITGMIVLIVALAIAFPAIATQIFSSILVGITLGLFVAVVGIGIMLYLKYNE